MEFLLNDDFIACGNIGNGVFDFVENKIMNGSVRLMTRGFKKLSLLDLRAQNGSIQNYNSYAFMTITVIMIGLIFAYSAMLIYFGG